MRAEDRRGTFWLLVRRVPGQFKNHVKGYPVVSLEQVLPPLGLLSEKKSSLREQDWASSNHKEPNLGFVKVVYSLGLLVLTEVIFSHLLWYFV